MKRVLPLQKSIKDFECLWENSSVNSSCFIE
jgi:hypothetical protein